jgi:aryl-alcohol dehydrogenase-like predicted oxidoreductase
VEAYRQRYWHEQNFAAVDALTRLADEEGRTMISLALSWLLHHTSSSAVIVGASSIDQLKMNLAAAEEGPLSENTVATCDAIWNELRGPSPKYNR